MALPDAAAWAAASAALASRRLSRVFSDPSLAASPLRVRSSEICSWSSASWTSRHLVAPGEHLRRQRPIALLERGQQRGLTRHGRSGGASRTHDVGVLRADSAQEADLLEQVAEAMSLEDHAHQIRAPLLVVRDQVRRQRLGRALQPVLEVDQMVAGLDQLALGTSKLRLTGGQRALQRGQPPVRVDEAVGGGMDSRRLGGDLRLATRTRRTCRPRSGFEDRRRWSRSGRCRAASAADEQNGGEGDGARTVE